MILDTRLAQIVDAVPEAILMVSFDGIIVATNTRAEGFFGYAKGELIGLPVEVLVPAAKRSNHVKQRAEFARNPHVREMGSGMELSAIRKDDSEFPAEISLSPLSAMGGSILMVVVRDLTRHKEMERTLRRQRERLRAIMDSIPDVVASYDRKGLLTYFNQAAEPYAEHFEHMANSVSVRGAAAPDALTRAVQGAIKSVIASAEPETIEHFDPVRNKTFQVRLVPELDENGEVEFVTSIGMDISHRKEMEARLLQQATHDNLTGLPNRSLLLDRITQAKNRVQRHHCLAAILFVDIDDFKAINDTLGHHVGDELLIEVANRLTGSLRSGDSVIRMGGDEFAVILEDVEKVDDIVRIVNALIEQIAAPMHLPGRSLNLECSIGVTIMPNDEAAPPDLLRHADIAMYSVKRSGKGGFALFSPEMEFEMRDRLDLRDDLAHAVERDELILHYQPKVSLRSGSVCGLEALVRWQHPTKGLIAPDVFIPVAEESGQIIEIGAHILRMACRQNRAWQMEGLPPQRVAVNLSVRQFRDPGLFALVETTLIETGLEPCYLELEITESLAMERPEQSMCTLHQLRAIGIVLSIDDFGTGYSSLAYLRQFPVDYVKVDRSFIRDVATNPNDAAIASAIISMAHRLGIQVVAEGVENRDHIEFLLRQHCDEFQGYYFSKPVAADKLKSLLRSRSRIDIASMREGLRRQVSLLILSKDAHRRHTLELVLMHEGLQIIAASDVDEAAMRYSLAAIEIVIADYVAEKSFDTSLLYAIRHKAPQSRILALGNADMLSLLANAVEQGLACAYMCSPGDVVELTEIIHRIRSDSEADDTAVDLRRHSFNQEGIRDR